MKTSRLLLLIALIVLAGRLSGQTPLMLSAAPGLRTPLGLPVASNMRPSENQPVTPFPAERARTALNEPALPDPGDARTGSREGDLLQAAPTIRLEALRAALFAWDDLEARGEIEQPLLTVIDYGLPSTSKRLWVFDLTARELLFHELVAHGKNSGENLAASFSNEDGTLMSSLGAFVTGTTYNGKNGYSLRLRGMDPGVNDKAEARTIVMHGAPYVGEEVAQKQGRLGRSWGCPALRPEIARTLIDRIGGGSLLYVWHPSIEAPRAEPPRLTPAARPASTKKSLPF